MRFSLKWLNEFTNTSSYKDQPELLTQKLTQAGFEVDHIENTGQQLQNVLVAEITLTKKHPNADRLTLCQVKTDEESFSIVCGAQNFKQGDRVALALPGAQLPNGLKIKRSRIRGEESQGMLASYEELGFKKQEDGIIILDKNSKLGEPISKALNCDDTLIDLSITPNRSDCLSHYGMARELSVLFDTSLKPLPTQIQTSSSVSVKKKLALQIEDTKNCLRYSCRLIKGVKVKESPDWLKQKLEALGKTSINNIVDITNYILLERGQPLHAFDSQKVSSLFIGPAKEASSFIGLDDQKYKLTGKELSIKDSEKVLALAGVIGSKDSGISDSTQDVLVESAWFSPASVRSTARRFGFQTDSSYQFSRGIDGDQVKANLDYACTLIQKVAGGQISHDFYDIYPRPIKSRAISISLDDIKARLNIELKPSEFKNMMLKLKCKVASKFLSKSFVVTPGLFRQDLQIKEDLIEECARLKGYSQIPSQKPQPISKIQASSPQLEAKKQSEDLLKQQGWHQTLHYSFSDPDFYQAFLQDKNELKAFGVTSLEEVSITNPISSQLALMKPLLMPDLLKTACNNYRKNNKEARLFEIGRVFQKKQEEYQEKLHLSLLKIGKELDFWKTKQDDLNLFYMKGCIESLLKSLGILHLTCWKQEKSQCFFHPKQNLSLYIDSECLGSMGSLHPELALKYKLQTDVCWGEFQIENLWQKALPTLRYKNISPHPFVERDLSFFIPQGKQVGQVKELIEKTLANQCHEVRLFDIYKKDQGCSASFRIFLNSQNQTWTDEKLNQLQNKVIETCKSQLGIGLS